VGRIDVFNEIESRFSPADSHNRVVLVGLGGVGYAFPFLVFLRLCLTHMEEIANCN
jgi:hypothetical protein